MTQRSYVHARLLAAVLVAGTLTLLGLTAAPVGGTDASQIQSGADVYAAHCAVCHGANLEGGAGPKLTEPGLHNRFASALNLYQYVKTTMPLAGDGPGSLSDAEYLAVVAFFIDARGVTYSGALSPATAGDVSLAPAATPIPTVEPTVSTPVPTPAVVATPAPSGNTPPQAPSIIEPGPALRARELSPFFMAMQTAPFADADSGDWHTASEFEIREFHSGVRVWSSTVTSWVRDQTVLEQGVFEGPLAQRMGLEHKTVYAIRARHRDSSRDPLSEWSAWSLASRRAHRPAGCAQSQPDAPAEHSVRHAAMGGGGWHARGAAARQFAHDHRVGEPAATRSQAWNRPKYLARFLAGGPLREHVSSGSMPVLKGWKSRRHWSHSSIASGVRRSVWMPYMKLEPGRFPDRGAGGGRRLLLRAGQHPAGGSNRRANPHFTVSLAAASVAGLGRLPRGTGGRWAAAAGADCSQPLVGRPAHGAGCLYHGALRLSSGHWALTGPSGCTRPMCSMNGRPIRRPA